ncbi:maintenance of mitochondrial structure and function-domain-containing protein [Fimicolochytrium jonesii]|uniref:maintenance of mitochondrial structure and function-domain-containing protein n=1 Tax=Fimicolochytrium jonesii TaxID=1396493 RepID=UPI0022FEF12D|nr:maintenance of mitochondrial structure and function-domain-containing protein [Fimicolochytrium jonesii]KAI8818521.1 maintenance of mitochondrial structure and function-domain-containing protein [Fimicolochytrium jonesii]
MATPMETDDPIPTDPAAQPSKIVSETPSASGLLITLHPLVILNASDHWTRVKMQSEGNANPQVIGALMGIQTGREIEIMDSFEIPITQIADDSPGPVLDAAFLIDKLEKFKQVFPRYDLLGWYSTGRTPTSTELHLHQQMIDHNESPLFMQLNPLIPPHAKDFPISIYESVIDLVGGQAQLLFLPSQYKIETGEAERIAVDHVAHATNDGAEAGSGLIAQLTGQRNAIKMLHSRISLLHKYVADVEQGRLPRDHNIMRQIGSLCNRLPTIDSPDFREEFLVSYNDVLLMTYLATVTKGANAVSELVDKFNVVGSKRATGTFPRGGVAYM